MSQLYQRGSIRRVKAKVVIGGEWRYRMRGVMRQETFRVFDYPTKSKLWAGLETRIRTLKKSEVPGLGP